MRVLKTISALIGAVCTAAIPMCAQAQSTDLIRFDHFTPHELRSASLTVTEPQTVEISAVGADERFPNHTIITSLGKSFNIVSNGNGDEEFAWRGNAWILDAATREPVWELRESDATRASKGIRRFNGSVQLKPGRYEVYYASYSAYRTETDWNDGKKGPSSTRYYDDGVSDEFQLTLRGSSNVRVEHDVLPKVMVMAIASLTDVAPSETKTIGLIVDRPTRVNVYAEGEARKDGSFDYGWIMNADTRQVLWSLDYDNSRSAGGASKNRMARETLTLQPGRYAVAYTMDESHDPNDWNQAPPLDPISWGITLTAVNDADRQNIHRFDYSPVPSDAIASITRVGDNEARSAGFTLDRPMDVRVLALGEGTNGDMNDYGWITDARTHRRVWVMDYDRTEHAGGAEKNRIASETVHLDAGSYMVNYRSDASHSFGYWNAGPPMDGELWGITVAPANTADRSAAKAYVDPPEDEALAQIVKIGDNARKRASFKLDSDSDVRVYALGEGTGGRMVDYGWIEDRATGRVLWEMTYRMTEHAGGATKNRLYDDVVHLPAGEYVLHYESDDSHSYRDWNDDAPDDPAHWGITVYRSRSAARGR